MHATCSPDSSTTSSKCMIPYIRSRVDRDCASKRGAQRHRSKFLVPRLGMWGVDVTKGLNRTEKMIGASLKSGAPSGGIVVRVFALIVLPQVECRHHRFVCARRTGRGARIPCLFRQVAGLSPPPTMFKKPLSNIKTSAPLRTSDRRKLRQRVVQTYGVSPELGDLLVPDGLMAQKVATYTNDPGVSLSV
jgi:hypothetical protein